MGSLLVITGASSGIGRATAKHFIENGYRVVNLSRGNCTINDVININCDLSRPNFAMNIRNSLVPHLSKANSTVLVHNAAQNKTGSIKETEVVEFQEVLQVNILAIHSLNQMVLPHMQPGSSIIYVGSTLAEKAVPGSFSYITSKHAQIGMMRATCQDLVASSIHTACICPGFTDTEMLLEHVGEENMEAIRSMNTFNRLIEPNEIAETIFWAARSPVINGTVIHANLGQIER